MTGSLAQPLNHPARPTRVGEGHEDHGEEGGDRDANVVPLDVGNVTQKDGAHQHQRRTGCRGANSRGGSEVSQGRQYSNGSVQFA